VQSIPNSSVINRFIKYCKFETTSDPNSKTTPSTTSQFGLAKEIEKDLKKLGISEVIVDEKCVLYATIPSNVSEEDDPTPVICFNAHLDTSPAEPGKNVNPQIVNFTGKKIKIGESNLEVPFDEIPDYEHLIGTKIITTDGTTLLGADDKAGIAEIITGIEQIMQNPEKKHGKIKLVFSPDEEIGKGADAVEISQIKADFGFSFDGGGIGTVESENFNAANGKIIIQGYNVHPGYAYQKMENSLRAIPSILQYFPKNQAPETTKDLDSYYHPYEITGDVNATEIKFILRNFDYNKLQKQIEFIRNGIKKVQEEFPNLKITYKISEAYKNMKDILNKTPEILKLAHQAIEMTGLTPKTSRIRGGTDGARFSYQGLPMPNIFTGGFNFHSKKEICSVFGMEKAVETVKNIVYLTYAKYNS
jgi:tripeptide aminopeptidase